MKLIFLATLAAALACAPAPSPDAGGADSIGAAPVALALDRASYAPGDAVTLTLTNGGAGQYYFNPCPRTVEQESGGSWTPVDEGQRMCTMEAWILDANGTRTAQTELPASLTAGRYRIAISLTREGEAPPPSAVRAVSAPFEVR